MLPLVVLIYSFTSMGKAPVEIIDIQVNDQMGCAQILELGQSKIRCWGLTEGARPANVSGNPISNIPKSQTSLSIAKRGVCVKGDAHKVNCWGVAFTNTNISERLSRVTNASFVSSGKLGQFCVFKMDHSKPICWESTETIPKFMPEYGFNYSRGGTYINNIANIGSATRITIGISHGCAVISNQIKCWGSPSNSGINVPHDIRGNVFEISAGAFHTCALSDEELRCWGRNEFGQSDVPQNLRNITELAIGAKHSCAISDNKVECWGDNSTGQLNIPFGLENPRKLRVGLYKTCVVTDKGIKCWGDVNPYVSTNPDGAQGAQVLSANLSQSCAVDKNNNLNCWGYPSYNLNLNDILTDAQGFATGYGEDCAYGAEGFSCWKYPTQTTEKLIITRESSRPVEKLKRGRANHGCVLYKDSEYDCWGMLWSPSYVVPYSFYPKLTSVKSFDVGYYSACVIDMGKVVCWGHYTIAKNIPENLTKPENLVSGGYHACVIDLGKVKCWGANRYGQIDVPLNLEPVEKIFAGDNNTCALENNGRLRCWGDNEFGQNNIPKDLENVSSVTIAKEHICARTGTLIKCWGNNNRGATGAPIQMSF